MSERSGILPRWDGTVLRYQNRGVIRIFKDAIIGRECLEIHGINQVSRRSYSRTLHYEWLGAILCVSTRTLVWECRSLEDLMLSLEDNPKAHRLNHEISCEIGIHWLTVHKIIYRDLQLNWVKRRRAQQLSETNRVARLTRCKQLP